MVGGIARNWRRFRRLPLVVAQFFDEPLPISFRLLRFASLVYHLLIGDVMDIYVMDYDEVCAHSASSQLFTCLLRLFSNLLRRQRQAQSFSERPPSALSGPSSNSYSSLESPSARRVFLTQLVSCQGLTMKLQQDVLLKFTPLSMKVLRVS